MNRGRPKLKIARTVDVHLRVTEFEAKKISRVAKQKNLSEFFCRIFYFYI